MKFLIMSYVFPKSFRWIDSVGNFNTENTTPEIFLKNIEYSYLVIFSVQARVY